MSSTTPEPPIMTVEEIRRIASKYGVSPTDEELEKAIEDLDFNARLYIASVKQERSKPMDDTEK